MPVALAASRARSVVMTSSPQHADARYDPAICITGATLNNCLARSVSRSRSIVGLQKARLLLLYAASILCAAWGATAHAKPVSPGFRAAILIRALGYERMAAEGQGDFVLAVVGGKDSESAADARMMYDIFQGLSQRLHVAYR
jgi:hypothetical protein